MKNIKKLTVTMIVATLLFSCQQKDEKEIIDASSSNKIASTVQQTTSYYGTTLPFASEAVYFLMTDRFVDGDPSNNQENQGGQFPTFQLPLVSKDGKNKAFVGYMGGDFKGILDNAQYISDMGFTSIWLTPIVDQPDQSFSGGEQIEFGGAFKDGGKTGYHGYWGDNFYQVDEHLPSKDLSFKQLTHRLKQNFQIKTVLDVVLNHGSPAFSMPVAQEKYGKIYDENWTLIADQSNLPAEQLSDNNPLHDFYNRKTEIVQLSDINENNPAALDYFVGAYLKWIDQGADAFRIDTIKHMPHSFWKKFSDRIRQQHPDFFMFAESYSFDAKFIAQHTYPENGGVSVLDFPGRETLLKIFENKNSNYADIKSYLHLTDGIYQNPYELMTFYDNHDMSRMNATASGFIDAHNWLFTSRGIPVIYYGSEIGFMAGTKEHEGNRNYFGEENITQAKTNQIAIALGKVANIRKNSIALQKGLQVNLLLKDNKAAFMRIYEHQEKFQTALVLLNKGDHPATFEINKYLSSGKWVDAIGGDIKILENNSNLSVEVAPHNLAVYLLHDKNQNLELRQRLDQLMVTDKKLTTAGFSND